MPDVDSWPGWRGERHPPCTDSAEVLMRVKEIGRHTRSKNEHTRYRALEAVDVLAFRAFPMLHVPATLRAHELLPRVVAGLAAELVDDPSPRVRSLARRCLTRQGPAAADALRRVLPRLRGRTAAAVNRIALAAGISLLDLMAVNAQEES